MGSELFWKVAEGSASFSDILECSEVLWGVLLCSERILSVVRPFVMFCYVLHRFKTFSKILSCSERFLYISRSLMFSIVKRRSEWFRGVFWRMWRSEAFLCLVSRFRQLSWSSEAFSYFPEYYEAYLYGWNICVCLRHCLIFWSVLRQSEAFSWIPSCSHRFLKVMRRFLMSWEFLVVLRYFFRFLSGSGHL